MSKYQENTKAWIEHFVITYNLCPFAAQPFQSDRIKYVLVEGEELETLVETTFMECMSLKDVDPKVTETTLIIHPNLLTDFDDYLSVLAQMQEDLKKLKLEGIIQLATFHPDYQFEGTDFDAPENFTNRSPYPMIHLLRENSVEKAIALHPDTHKIPFENIKTMNRIGSVALIQKSNEIIREN